MRKIDLAKNIHYLIFAFLLGLTAMPAAISKESENHPNIIYILADDLGYGDVSILNPERGKIPTPNIDRLGKEGMIFTDAHTNSSVCTPTRYGIMTGRYAWRTLTHGVLGGSSKPLIPPTRMTVGSFLKSQGYQTACIGKWHLGMEMVTLGEGKKVDIDFRKPIQGGPTALGFDYYFGVSASLDMAPYVYIENDHFTSIPTKTTKDYPEKVPASRCRPGAIAEDFVFDQVLPQLTDRATAYIQSHAKKEQPFFLYFPLTGPHTPIVPSKEFKGKTKLGDYGDFCVEVDAMLGRVMEAVEKAGITQNTWIIFTSDNGCSRAADPDHLESLGHYPSAQFRGMKTDVWEGGHRVPFMMRWPQKIKPGSITNETICHTDFMATCADLLGKSLPDNAAEDSVSLLPVMFGKSYTSPLREAIVHHSFKGVFAIRQGNWKLEFASGSGGSSKGPKESVGLPPIQLYEMSTDSGEQHNVQAQHPEIVKSLTALLKKYVDQGRSTPGKPQKNEVSANFYGKHGGKSGGKEEEGE